MEPVLTAASRRRMRGLLLGLASHFQAIMEDAGDSADMTVGIDLPENAWEAVTGVTRPATMKGNAIQASDHVRPTLLRALITERHWQRFRTFGAQFRRAARELAERESDPDLAKLTVSSRQRERWYAGKR